MAAQSMRTAAAFGQVVSILLRAEPYRSMCIADLEWLIVPAIATGQYAVAARSSEATGVSAPVGVVLWASVSEVVAAKFAQTPAEQIVRPGPQDWQSGEIVWIIDAIGDATVIGSFMQDLRKNHWPNRDVRLRTRGKDGHMHVMPLPLVPAQSAGM